MFRVGIGRSGAFESLSSLSDGEQTDTTKNTKKTHEEHQKDEKARKPSRQEAGHLHTAGWTATASIAISKKSRGISKPSSAVSQWRCDFRVFGRRAGRGNPGDCARARADDVLRVSLEAMQRQSERTDREKVEAAIGAAAGSANDAMLAEPAVSPVSAGEPAEAEPEVFGWPTSSSPRRSRRLPVSPSSRTLRCSPITAAWRRYCGSGFSFAPGRPRAPIHGNSGDDGPEDGESDHNADDGGEYAGLHP